MKQEQLKLIREEGYKLFYFMFAQTILILFFFGMHRLRGYIFDLFEIFIFVIVLLVAEQILLSLHLFDIFTRRAE